MVLNQTIVPNMVEATGLEPAASCSQSKRATKLRHASILSFLFELSARHFFALLALLRFPKFITAQIAYEF